jgi:hypothetical protein
MLLYLSFSLPLVIAYLYNPMMHKRTNDTHAYTSKVKCVRKIDWYHFFTRVLDNTIMIFPPVFLYLTTQTSSRTHGNHYHNKHRKRYTHKTRFRWNTVIHTLITQCMMYVPWYSHGSNISRRKQHYQNKLRYKYKYKTSINRFLQHNNNRHRFTSSYYNPICCTTENTTKQNNKPCPMIFDSDSIPIRVDKCCSRTLSGSIHDFYRSTIKRVSTNMTITGFGGSETRITHAGTIVWNIRDDDGINHEIHIPNSFYIPQSKHRLLSPQHWAQESCDVASNDNSTWCATHKDRVVLY